MLETVCPHCGNPIVKESDQYGSRLYCRLCAWQQDMLQDRPEIVALRVKIDDHSLTQERKAPTNGRHHKKSRKNRERTDEPRLPVGPSDEG